MPTPDERLLRLIDYPDDIPTPAEQTALKGHISSARFSKEQRELGVWNKNGPDLTGLPNPFVTGEYLSDDTMLDAAQWHVLKHTVCPPACLVQGTTVASYQADITTAVRAPGSSLHVGRANLGFRHAARAAVTSDLQPLAAALSSVIVNGKCHLFVVYDPSRKCLSSAYTVANWRPYKKMESWQNRRSFP